MKLPRIVLERPGLVFIFVIAIILLSAYSAMNVEMSSGTENFFSKDNKVYQQYKLYEKNFARATGAVFIFIKGDDVVNYEAYNFMLTLGDELKKIEGVESVTSPASIIREQFGFLPTDEKFLKDVTEKYFSDLVPKRTLAMVMVQLKPMDSARQEEVAKNIEKSLENIEVPAGYKVEITGSPVLGYQIKGEILKSLGVTMMASVFLMVLFLFVTFSGVTRRKWTAFLPLVISVSSVIIIYGMMPLLGIPLSEHTNGALPMLVGLAIEYGVQIQNRFEEEIRKHGVDVALELAVERTGRALLLSLLTTIVGFMSMLSVGIPAMSWFGIIASLGLTIAYILSITFLPALLKIIEERGKVKKEEKAEEKKARLEQALEMVSGLTASRPFGILVVALVISAVGLYVSPMIKLETNYNKYVPQNLPSIQKFSELEELVGGQTIYTLVLETDGVDPRVLEKSRDLADYILSKEELIYKYDAVNPLVETYGGLEKVPEAQLNRYVSGSTLAINFYSTAGNQEEYKSTLNSLYKDIEFYGWDGEYYVTGQPVVYSELGSIMIDSQTTMTLVAYVGILAVLLLIYRSLRKAIVPLLAITSVIGIMNLVMFISGVKQTMVSIALNSIVLGLGIDYSIMITERYLEERQSVSPAQAVRRAIEYTGKATTTSALATMGGFGALMLSTFPVMRDFGFLALVSISLSLLAAFTVVPAFLMLTERLGERLKKSS
ncbi:MAG: MMPL family transporter [Archaeoglobales archaeon]|nr:MMPL family transporter [Archaeoglobales archaeon]